MPLFSFPTAATATSSATTEQKLDWLGTVRARLGFLVTDQLLVFATGGLAYGHVTAQTTVSETVASMEAASGSLGSVFQHLAAAQARRQAHTRKRASEGLSEQYAITRNWSLKTEYLHWDLGRADYTLTPLSVQTLSTLGLGVGTVATSTTVGTTASARFSGDFVRASVNYKFD